jgi:hypothetical protein
MSTSQIPADKPKPRLGDMYLRAEQRHREEMAAAQLTAILTPPVPSTHSPLPADHRAANVAGTNRLTEINPPAIETPGPVISAKVAVPASPTAAVIAPTAAIAPLATKPHRAPRRGSPLVPMAVLSAVAIVALFGVALTVSDDEPSTLTARSSAPVTSPPQPVAIATSTQAATELPKPVAARPEAATKLPEATSVPAAPKPAVVRPARAAATASAAATPRAAEGELRITSNPTGSRVTVDGIGWGQTPLTIGHLTFGTKTVRLTHDGYRSHQAVVSITGDRAAQTISVAMTRR